MEVLRDGNTCFSLHTVGNPLREGWEGDDERDERDVKALRRDETLQHESRTTMHRLTFDVKKKKEREVFG